MLKKKLLSTVALSLIMFMACGCTKPGEKIIEVNEHPITKSEFNKAFDKAVSDSMFAKMGIDVKKDPNSFLYLMIKDRVVNELIVKSLLDEEMKSKNIKATKEEIEEEHKSMIDRVGSKEKFNEILKQNGISNEQFKEDLVEGVKLKKLIETIKVPQVSDADAKKFYNANMDKFKYPDKVRASHILISANRDEIAQILQKENKNLTEEELNKKINDEVKIKKEKAQKILAQLKADKSQFEKLARENSDDVASAKQGGDLGFFAKEEMVEPFAVVAFKQKPNTISEIVETPYGYHIIMVTDRAVAGVEPYEKVKEEIKTYLTNSQQVEILQKYIESLRQKAQIKYLDNSYNPEVIQKDIKEASKDNKALMESQKQSPQKDKK